MGNLWWTEPDGVLASEAGGFRLVVRETDEWVRYLVLRHPGHAQAGQLCRSALVASGHGDDVETAMLAAEKAAARLTGTGNRRV